MIYLLDVNLLIALAWPSHVHHLSAQHWFQRVGRKGWASCPLTQTGFVRISSNPSFIDGAVDPKVALRLLGEVCQASSHSFWPDDLDLSADPAWPASHLIGHRQVTDAYLLGLAIKRRGKLATLDAGIRALLPVVEDREACLKVISA